MTKYGEEYGWNGVAWCAIFIWWLYKNSGLSSIYLNGGKTASCTAIKEFYEKYNQWFTNNNYYPGDIAIMSFKKSREIQHCGLIVEQVDDMYYKIIEGNTSSSAAGSQDNGGIVALRTRNINNILGVARPQYETEEDEDMTDEKFAEMMNTYLANLAKQEPPKWAEKELAEARELGITDATRPMQLIPRYQAAIMALRAAKIKKIK